MTKFLIHSNAPEVATGYGVQCAHLADYLAEAGHEVAVSATYGHQGSIGVWTSPRGHRIRVYPMGYETNGNDVIHSHADHWFEGDPSAGWIIPLLDVWCLRNPLLAEFQVAAWTPVDHLPVPRDVVGFFKRSGAVPVAMSRFGERQLVEAGLDPSYVPLTVDTTVFKPSFQMSAGGSMVDARTIFNVPHDSFCVGMVAMNKGWARDRKGFNEAFRAFGQFWKRHNNAVLLVHSEKHGAAEGIDLVELAQHCAIPEHALIWTDQYAYRLGVPANMMAAMYTAMDVLLAPSHGEGFGVPLIEAQACGTPVIASDFSSQTELVGAGWLVDGQLEWDPSQHSSYLCPFSTSVLEKLEEAYTVDDWDALAQTAIAFASNYDTARVFEQYWEPVIASLLPPVPVVRPVMESVDVLVPFIRESNRERLLSSYVATRPHDDGVLLEGVESRTYAENVNALLDESTADWVLIVGDDTEFLPGWFEAAAAVSATADVIGTNDSEVGRVRNPDVAAGRHADHFFVRRSYIMGEGASLDGPGVLMPDCYQHWYIDKEVVGLAKARGVFTFAEDCRIIHHHPGFDGDETARQADPIYMRAVDASDADRRTFMERVPFIESHRVSR